MAPEIWTAVTGASYAFGVALVYGLHYFNSLSHLVIIEKRYPNLVKAECLTAIFYCFIGLPIWFNAQLHATDFGIPNSENILQPLGGILAVFCNNIILNCEACRLFLLYFHLNYLHSISNKQWKSVIDKSFSTKDWYLQNATKYGNLSYILKRGLVYCFTVSFIVSLFIAGFDGKYYTVGQLLNSITVSVPIFFIIYTYLKCPKKITDNFLFQYEYKATTFIFFTGLLMYVANIFLKSLEMHTLNATITAFIALYTFPIPSLLSTIWISYKIKSNKMWSNCMLERASNNGAGGSIILDMMTQHSAHESEDGNTETPKTSMEYRMRQMLLNEQLFEEFVQFMIKEFSSETILCFVEFVQFKECMIEYMKLNDSECEFDNHSLSENIPKSTIVYDDSNKDAEDMVKMFRHCAHLLYEKYVMIGGEFEVNISSVLRGHYLSMDVKNWEMSMNEFLNVFDCLVKEMYNFMRHSYRRYERSLH